MNNPVLLDTKTIDCNITPNDYKALERSPTFELKENSNHQKVFYIHTKNFKKYIDILDELLLINNTIPSEIFIVLTQFFIEFSQKNKIDIANYEYQFRIQADYVMHDEYFMPAEMHCDVSNYTIALPLSETGNVDDYSLWLGLKHQNSPQQNDGPFKVEHFPKEMRKIKYKKNEAILFCNRQKSTIQSYHQASLCKATKKGIVRQQAILFCKHKKTKINKYESNYEFDPKNPNEPVMINGTPHYWIWDFNKNEKI